MAMNMFRHRTRRNVFVVSISALALAPLFIFAWAGPTQSPPTGNVAAPINVGTTDQVKGGGLGVNALTVFGNSLFGGSTGSNAYLNFGETSAEPGYGIRDNAGLLEFKNSGGSWASIQSTVFNLVGGTGSWTASDNDIYNSNTGNVGIGTTTPRGILHVEANEAMITACDIGGAMSSSRPAWAFGPDGSNFRINSTGTYNAGDPSGWTNRFTIDASGKVGIGTTNPGDKLDVQNGNINTNNYLKVSAWPGHGSGSAKLWFDGDEDTLVLDDNFDNRGSSMY